MEEDIGDVPAEEDDNDSDRDEGGRLFAWMVNDDMDEDEEEEEEEEDDDDDDEEEVEDEQLLDTEASESFELDAPAERSGHIAVVDRNIMYVWGGYKVRGLLHGSILYLSPPLQSAYLLISHLIPPLYKNSQNHGFFDLYLPRNEIWAYNMESGVW